MRPEIGMKIKLEQRASCLAAGLHAVLATRQLKEGVYLKTARAAQQVLSRDAARDRDENKARATRVLSCRRPSCCTRHSAVERRCVSENCSRRATGTQPRCGPRSG